jgi:NAD(P)H-dependent flavin oxidoreductase YrpB (nitropropane dioxygenase family)
MPLDTRVAIDPEVVLKTRLTDLLGIKYPIIQCGMSHVSGVAMAAAVSNAGGLGILASYGQTTDQLRRNIASLRELVGNKPFGVNCVPVFPGYQAAVKAVIEEKVPVLSHGLGNPFQALGGKPDNLVFMPTVGTVKQAVFMQKGGADAIVLHGFEGGGHPGTICSTVLIPKAVDNLKIPVVASGGFTDGRGLVAALALGAEGIGLGTRFAASEQSLLKPNIREWFVKSSEKDPTVSFRYDGLHLRAIKSNDMKGYRGWWSRPFDLLRSLKTVKQVYGMSNGELWALRKQMKQMGMPVMQLLASERIGRRTMVEGVSTEVLLPSGQVTGRIDEILTCEQIIERIVAEATATLRSLGGRIKEVEKISIAD